MVSAVGNGLGESGKSIEADPSVGGAELPAQFKPSATLFEVGEPPSQMYKLLASPEVGPLARLATRIAITRILCRACLRRFECSDLAVDDDDSCDI